MGRGTKILDSIPKGTCLLFLGGGIAARKQVGAQNSSFFYLICLFRSLKAKCLGNYDSPSSDGCTCTALVRQNSLFSASGGNR